MFTGFLLRWSIAKIHIPESVSLTDLKPAICPQISLYNLKTNVIVTISFQRKYVIIFQSEK